MSDTLPPDLREKLAAYARKNPSRGDVIDRLLEKRQRTSSPAERDTIEKMLHALVNPNRTGWYIAGVVVALLVAVWTVIYVGEERQRQAVMAGDKVVAYIERMDDGDCLIGDKTTTCVHLVLRLHPSGQESYSAELTGQVHNRYLPRVQSGSWLTVAVDRQDRNVVMIDEQSLAVPPPPPLSVPSH